jgi:uncharacterized protein YndB with AHSA1/START domain
MTEDPAQAHRTVRRAVDIAAPAETVWELVSDLPGMARFSPENQGGRWRGGTGPAAGAVFRGSNAQGRRRWSTRSTVVRCEPGRAFAFDVSATGLPVARWSYDLADAPDGGCRLTETWEDRRGRLLRTVGGLLTGVGDRTSYSATSIEQTLTRVKETAERTAVG